MVRLAAHGARLRGGATRRWARAGAIGSLLTLMAAGILGSSCRQVVGIEDIALTCTNIESDAKNCGACGHDCLGGECKMGACQPVRLFTRANDPPVTMAVTPDHVYVAFAFSLVGCELTDTGCADAPRVYYVPDMSNPNVAANVHDVAPLGDKIFFMTTPGLALDGGFGPPPGGIWSVLPDGGSLIEIAGNQSQPLFLGAGGDAVVWTNLVMPAYSGQVLRCPSNGGACAQQTVFTSPYVAAQVFATASTLYVFSEGINPFVGTVARCPLDAPCPKPTQLYNGGEVDTHGAIAFDGKDSFASFTEAGDLVLLHDNGGATLDVNVLGTSMPFSHTVPVGVAIDDAHIYVTATDRIRRFDRQSGAADDLAIGQPSPELLATDAKAIYWANDDGSVWRLAR